MDIVEKEIREKLVQRLQEAAGAAKILKRNPYTMDRNLWLGAFTFDDNGTKRTHAWFVKRYLVQKRHVERHYTYGYNMVGYYGFRFGSDEDNSEDEFQLIVDNVIDKFNDDEIWDFVGRESHIAGEELVAPNIGLQFLGKSKYVHVVPIQFMLQVHPC